MLSEDLDVGSFPSNVEVVQFRVGPPPRRLGRGRARKFPIARAIWVRVGCGDADWGFSLQSHPTVQFRDRNRRGVTTALAEIDLSLLVIIDC